jgi:DNA-directed RNA polymerase specialized sigma24 family protein
MAERTFRPERDHWAGTSCAVSLQHHRQRHHRYQATRDRQETPIENPDLLLDDQPGDDDLRLDVEQVLLRLPEDLARIARMLMLHNLTQAARELAMPRSSLQARIQELRTALRRLQPKG